MLPHTIRLDSTGLDVARWRARIGLPAGDIFDAQTDKWTRDWQRDHGLKDDGTVGPATWSTALGMPKMTSALRTVLEPAEAMRVLRDAFLTTIGVIPAPSTLAILGAQSALETAKWKSMWCWNFGNIRGQYHGQWTSFRAGENLPDGSEVILQPGPANRFRAYTTAALGAENYIEFLAIAGHPPNPNRYQAAWDAALDGDVVQFVRGLKAGGYFTAGEARYLSAEQGLFAFTERLAEHLEEVSAHAA